MLILLTRVIGRRWIGLGFSYEEFYNWCVTADSNKGREIVAGDLAGNLFARVSGDAPFEESRRYYVSFSFRNISVDVNKGFGWGIVH